MDFNAEHAGYSRRGGRSRAPASSARQGSPVGIGTAVRPTNPLLTISEVADLIGVHRSTLYRTIGRASLPLPVVRVGATMRVPRAAVERMLSGDVTSRELLRPPVPATPADRNEAASYCSACGSAFPASSRPMCSAARRSSSPTEAV